MHEHRLSRRELLLTGGGAVGLAMLPACTAGKKERLTITQVDLHKIIVPMKPDITADPELAESSSFDAVPKMVMKIHTDSGITGIGETGRGEKWEGVERNAEFLKGKAIFDFNLTKLDLPDPAGYAAFEMALYDTVGKAVGWPVYRLLGGLAQPKVLVGYWCGRKTPEGMKRVAERALAGKFKNIKTKNKQGDPIVEAIEMVAKVAPGITVILDPNTRYNSLKDFLEVALKLEKIGNMLVYEDPFDKTDYEGYRKLRSQVKTHVALHLGDTKAMIKGISEQACSAFNTGGNPGMASFVSNCYLAQVEGMPVWHGSGNDLGIMDAAYTHSCAASPNCTLPSDILGFLREDDLVVSPIEIKDSYAIVPDRPGLGVELDEDAAKKYHTTA
jgi:muconate cycloisomerase